MTAKIEEARKFLESLHRFDLAMLITPCETEVFPTTINNGFFDETVEMTQINAPVPVDEALRALPDYDLKRISEALVANDPSAKTSDHIYVETIANSSAMGTTALLAELIIHREMMISVGTGGKRIQEVNDYYIARQDRLLKSLPDDIEYQNNHSDLWAWYRYWKENLGGYADRRQYVRDLFAPAINALSKRSPLQTIKREETGWERVDRALSKARSQFELASNEEDYQAVGLLCREIIISLAQAVFDPKIHETLDGVTASSTDANRMLDAYVAHAFPGSSNKEIRAHNRASLALALNLQHRRTAEKQLAALCLEATASTAAVISIIARDSR